MIHGGSSFMAGVRGSEVSAVRRADLSPTRPPGANEPRRARRRDIRFVKGGVGRLIPERRPSRSYPARRRSMTPSISPPSRKQPGVGREQSIWRGRSEPPPRRLGELLTRGDICQRARGPRGCGTVRRVARRRTGTGPARSGPARSRPRSRATSSDSTPRPRGAPSWPGAAKRG